MTQELTPEVQKVVDKVEKLLRLAAKNPNKEEAASAASKAQELLAAYNLDMASVEQAGQAKRADEKLAGGLYKYQRELWRAVARLNFCLYWNMYTYDPDKVGKSRSRYDGKVAKRQGGWRFEHRIVGRTVNIAATKAMAGYLEEAIERLTREELHGDAKQFFTRWAVSFREGMADTIRRKVEDRREQVLSEERIKERAAADAAANAVSTSKALTLSNYIDKETDANVDFLYGEGTSAKRAARRAAQAAAEREADEAYTKWAAENPEKAKAEEEKARKRSRRSSWNAGMAEDKRDWSAYSSGRERGKDVGIDPQTGTRKAGRIA